MLINADFSQPAVVTPDDYRWSPSPQAGVERVMLDRIGGEVARATSLVRYAAHSRFPAHDHELGEEILVLAGVFSDESQDFPDGWYIRNPPGSSHRPSSLPGALIFVKLRQMRVDERLPIRVDSKDPRNWSRGDGRAVCRLYSGPGEVVSLQRLDAGLPVLSKAPSGAELFVVEGGLTWGNRQCASGTWIRLPPGHRTDLVAGETGVTIYLKTGHLGSASFPAGPAAG